MGPAPFKVVELGASIPVGVDVSPLIFVEAPASFSNVLISLAVVLSVHFLVWRGRRSRSWASSAQGALRSLECCKRAQACPFGSTAHK